MEQLSTCPACHSENLIPFIECRDHFLTGEVFRLQECGSCGLKFTNPRPAAGELGLYYKSSEYISHSNSNAGLFNRVYQVIRKYTLLKKYRMIHRIHPSGRRILDIGCATGEFLNTMKLKGWDVAGIEPDEEVRMMARQKYGLNVLDESEILSFGEGKFDVITLWHVLEHVAGLSDRMKAVEQLLVPGGILILALPNPESADARHYKSYWAGYDVPRHLYHFSKSSIRSLITKYSFTLLEILPMKFDAFYVSLLSEKYRHGKMRWIPAIWQGWMSNRRAKAQNNFSSLIYICRKERMN